LGKNRKKNGGKKAARKSSPAPARSAIGRALPLELPAEMEREIDDSLGMATRRFTKPDRLHPMALPVAMQPYSINDDLARDLPRLMAECAWRFATSPLFEGVCNTFTQDVVGPEGPTLQMVSTDKEFNERIEDAWRAVFTMPDPAGRLSGVENVKMWVRQLLLAGSYVNIHRNVRRGPGLPTFGWSTVHARRLQTPMEFAFDEDVAFGVRIDPATGRPKTYYIERPQRFGSSEISVGDYQQFPAEMVQHKYFCVEPEQLTGYPMMASTLRTLDDIVQLDDATIEAAKSAARHSWWLQSADPSKLSDPDPITGTTYPVIDGAANVAPAGWQAVGMQATQPNTSATEYRNLRLAEIGRPINMPLLIVLLSVNEATFSSAQFAGALYRDGIMGIQRFLARESLDAFVEMVILDEVLAGRVRRPKKYTKQWTHNVPPYANIEKFVGALEKMVANGWISSAEASAMLGYDWEKVVAGRQRCQKDLEEAGLPLPPVNAGNPPKPEVIEGKPPIEPPRTTDADPPQSKVAPPSRFPLVGGAK
jgi:capsid protein